MEYDFDRDISIGRSSDARAAFIRSTYAHLAGAVLAFIALETILLQVVTLDQIITIFGRSPWSLLLVFGAFMAAGWIAQTWPRSETSKPLQYLGLALYVVAEAVIFLPLLYIAVYFVKDPYLIPEAGVLTLAVFGGLSLSVFVTKKDYTFLGPILSVCSMIALGVIICAIFFPINLGLLFSFAMVALMSGYILYETSVIMQHHRTDQPVAAALMLFSSVATLFYYILRILIIMNRR